MNCVKMIPGPNPRDARRAVDAFNAAHPVGTPVLVEFLGCAERPGETISRAFCGVGGPSVLVGFIGIEGRFTLSRVRRAISNLDPQTSNHIP